MRLIAAAVAAFCTLTVASCSSGTPSTAPASPTPARTTFPAGGCPVEDASFCRRAATAATALATRDAAGLMALSSLETFACDQVPAGMVSNCRPGATLSGLGTFAVATKITVSTPEEFRDRLDTTFNGSGEVAVLGVGTCGPADLDRRSYHLQFTLVLDGQAWLGSLEFVHRNRTWTFPMMYFDSVTSWRTEHADPFRDTACGNVRAWQ